MAFDRTRPGRMTVGISAAGAFRSDEGGAVGQCLHHMEIHPQRPEILYQQNHCGVYRSDNSGDSWVDVSEGLPSRFGFPIAALPHDGDTIFVIPEESDHNRMTPDGRFGIYRSRTRGSSWERLSRGLPQSNVYMNVMRMAMTSDVIFNWLPPIYSLETAVVS